MGILIAGAFEYTRDYQVNNSTKILFDKYNISLTIHPENIRCDDYGCDKVYVTAENGGIYYADKTCSIVPDMNQTEFNDAIDVCLRSLESKTIAIINDLETLENTRVNTYTGGEVNVAEGQNE